MSIELKKVKAGDPLSAEQYNLLVEAVQGLMQAMPGGTLKTGSAHHMGIPAIRDEGPNWFRVSHDWDETCTTTGNVIPQNYVRGSFVGAPDGDDFVPGRDEDICCYLRQDHKDLCYPFFSLLRAGAVVLAQPVWNVCKEAWDATLISQSVDERPFVVEVCKDGGASGTWDICDCTYTYEVYDWKGRRLDVCKTPEHARINFTPYYYGGEMRKYAGKDTCTSRWGLAHYDVCHGQLVLLIAYGEVPKYKDHCEGTCVPV